MTTNNNLYTYMKKLFPEKKPTTLTGRVVSKDGSTLVIEDTLNRRTRVKNFTGNDYSVGTTVFVSDNIVIGRAKTGTGASVYHI